MKNVIVLSIIALIATGCTPKEDILKNNLKLVKIDVKKVEPKTNWFEFGTEVLVVNNSQIGFRSLSGDGTVIDADGKEIDIKWSISECFDPGSKIVSKRLNFFRLPPYYFKDIHRNDQLILYINQGLSYDGEMVILNR